MIVMVCLSVCYTNSDKGEQCLLSCINDPGDWQNGVQLWKIDSSTEKV